MLQRIRFPAKIVCLLKNFWTAISSFAWESTLPRIQNPGRNKLKPDRSLTTTEPQKKSWEIIVWKATCLWVTAVTAKEGNQKPKGSFQLFYCYSSKLESFRLVQEILSGIYIYPSFLWYYQSTSKIPVAQTCFLMGLTNRVILCPEEWFGLHIDNLWKQTMQTRDIVIPCKNRIIY